MASRSYAEPVLRWLETVFAERFGHAFDLYEASGRVHMCLEGHTGSIAFGVPDPAFTRSSSEFPCFQWVAAAEGFIAPIESVIPAPGSLVLKQPLIELQDHLATIHYDLPGMTYWILTRKEEIGRTDLDSHQRFTSSSSHAFRNGYLERPVVDEWLYILAQVIRRVWPRLELKQHRFQVKVSHDVDRPARYAFQNFKGLIRTLAGDVLLRRQFDLAFKGPLIWMSSRRNQQIHPQDPVNTFSWLMDQSEANGLTSAFYFICGRTDAAKDALYEPETPHIRKLMKSIHRRGHEIGLHPSYNTYNRPGEIAREADRLRRACAEEGIAQSVWGGRMHYLRWDQAVTLKAWNDAGMTYDSTLTYADRPGFRCGTCFEYPAFDVSTNQALSLRVRPLVAMESTVIADRYLGLGSTEAALEKFEALKSRCRKVQGTFTLLWHNSYFNTQEDFRIYSQLLSVKR